MGGAACTQLTSLTGKRATAFAKPAAMDSHMQVCNSPRVNSMTPRSNAMAPFQRKGKETGPPRRRRDRAASKEDRERNNREKEIEKERGEGDDERWCGL